MLLYATYLRAYALSRARAVIPVDALPDAKKVAELAAFALGVGDGPAKEEPDRCVSVCHRVATTLWADAADVLAVREAEDQLKGAVTLASATKTAA